MMRRGAAIDIEAPSAILAADIHLRDTCPICREEEEFFAAQWNKFEEMLSLAQRYGCPILVAGDFFHHWKASPGLLSRTMEAIDKFPKVRITCIYGQHDLPNHNYSDRIKSGLYTLEVAGYLNSVEGGGSWGGEFDQDKDCMEIDGAKVGMIHELVFDTVPWKNCNARTAREILNAYPKCDLILTGDNHNTFTKKDGDGRLLVNPGSMTRQNSSQTDHEPCVFLWYAGDNSAEKFILRHEKNAVKTEHITETAERNERIEAFITKLKDVGEYSIDFEHNLRRYMDENKISRGIRETIEEAMREGETK